VAKNRVESNHMKTWGSVKRRRFAAIATVFALALAGCTTGGDVSVRVVENPQPNRPATVNPQEAAGLINAYRASHGLPPVSLDPTLMAVATDHARKMAALDKLDHVLPGEGSFPQRLAAHNYDATIAAENIGAGYPDLNDAFSGWRASPHHNDNLLKQGVTQIGIAVAFSPTSRFGNFWSLVLATPDTHQPMTGPNAGPPIAVFGAIR
jgi:uncharacterized protein YkwD